ncbi:hypothetical protein Salmuc_04039 [Salipiger mucosus DSM 16094]|uniref:Uncharacterized protein n=1 Tax=Salipiger mucosus DSM 16094 TaxID=1123237 RepID=S9S7U5_9RHOB|nr:hypothetical protein Salmuc_04039 [Salipiger mucosus DSM 16094]
MSVPYPILRHPWRGPLCAAKSVDNSAEVEIVPLQPVGTGTCDLRATVGMESPE